MCSSGWDTHCPPPAFSPVRGGEGAQLDWGLLHRGRTVKLGFVAFNDDWGLHLLKGPILHPCIDLCFSSRIPLRKLVTADYLHVIFSPLFAASRLLASKLVPCWTFYVFGRGQKRGGLRGGANTCLGGRGVSQSSWSGIGALCDITISWFPELNG